MAWDDATQSVETHIADDLHLNNGEELWVPLCYNNTPDTIKNGRPVYIDGASTNNPTIKLASNITYDESRLIGVATQDIPPYTKGRVTRFGFVNEVNLSGCTAGGNVYLGDKVLTHVRPMGGLFPVVIGKAIVCTTVGRLLVYPQSVEYTSEVNSADGWASYLQGDQTNISFVDATRIFSVAPVAPTFYFYQAGLKYIKTGTQSITISDVEGLHIIYYDLGVLSEMVNPSSSQIVDAIRNKVITSVIYWDATNKISIYVSNERHTFHWPSWVHAFMHAAFGTQYNSGLGLTNITLGIGSVNADAQFGIDSGTISDEDIVTTTNAVTSTAGIPIYYRLGVGMGNWRRITRSGYAFLNDGTTGLAMYNLESGGTWSIVSMTNNYYRLVHVFATNDISAPNKIIAMSGVAQYSSAADAEAAVNNEIANIYNSNLPFAEVKHIGSLILHTKTGLGNTVNARYVAIPSKPAGANYYMDFRKTSVLGAGGGGSGATSFLGLSDTPDSYAGQANKIVGISGGETGTEFKSVTATSAGTINIPTGQQYQLNGGSIIIDAINDAVTTTAPSQNAVFDALAGKEPTLTKGNLTAGSFKVSIGGTGTGAVIGAGVSVDVDEANLTLSNIGGSVLDSQVPNSITLTNITQITNRSHTNLSDIGTNTHPQIDTHITNDGDLSATNELSSSVTWTDATNTIGVIDAGGTKTAIITGFLEGNQTITLSGDVSGSGTTAITTTVADDSHSHTTSTLPNIVSSVDGVVNDGGDIDLVQGGIVTITPSDVNNNITISATEVDGSTTNEGVLSVIGTSNNAAITSNSSGSNTLNIKGGGINQVSVVGNDITITGTEAQTLSGLGGQPQLNGTGFVKASGTTISYDNSTYEPAFSKNTAFNKNFGTTAGTVLEGRTFGTAANNNTGDFLSINGGTMGNTNLVNNLNAQYIGIIQDSGEDRLPSYYLSQKTTAFVNSNIAGTLNTNWYSGLNVAGLIAGTHSSWQIFGPSNGNTHEWYLRDGVTTWSNPYRIWHSGNFDPTTKAPASGSGNYIWNSLTQQPTSNINISGMVDASGYKLNGNNLFNLLSNGYLSNWDGFKFVNSSIYQEALYNRVGIGTTGQSAGFAVSANINNAYTILMQNSIDDYTAFAILGASTNLLISPHSDRFSIQTNTSGKDLELVTNGGNIRLLSTGQTKISNLAGTGTRLLTALTDGTLSTTTSSSGATNLSTTQATSTVTVNSDTGTDAIIPAATQSLAGVLNTVDKTKIDNLWNTSVQSLSGTTPTWNATNGINATITLSGNTTITLSNLVSGMTGNIRVTNAASVYEITVSGYTNKISPSVYTTANKLATSGNSKIDVFSWWYDGTILIWNGSNDYK